MERRFPLDILVVGLHYHSPKYRTAALRRLLREHPAVRSYGSTQQLDEARTLTLQGEVNTIFTDPCVGLGSLVSFIHEIRKERPRTIFVIYAEHQRYRMLLEQFPEIEHYFSFNIDEQMQNYFSVDPQYRPVNDYENAADQVRKGLDAILRRCEESHRDQFQYDVAISFAGADRNIARSLAHALTESGIAVFFDEYEESDLLGKDLYDHLTTVYSKRARYSLMLVSRSYADRVWPTLERRSMQERALIERGKEYIIPIRIDDTPITGLLSTIGYVSITKGVTAIADLIYRKLWMVD